MLGKQLWRLIHNLESLFHKVFKAKFFPNCSVMDSEVKTNGTYAWQSILKARECIRMGAIWRIRDGRKVRIRGDKWLPTKHSSSIASPQKNFPSDARVCAIIDEEGPNWILDRVQDKFLPHKAQAVLSIPLSLWRGKDTLIWAETDSGKYPTKSAYKLLSTHATSLAPGTSDPATNNTSWSNIWTLNVPNKVKHFIWRACHESLPTKKNLLIRKVTRNSICERCQSEIEDTVHALWGCQLWSTGAFWDSGAGVGLGNFLYIYIENIFFLYIFTIKILLKNTLLSLIHKTKKEGKKHSEMRILAVPARFKANFGLFWPFWSPADTTWFWPNQLGLARIEAESARI